MEAQAAKDDARWSHVVDSIDLLFAKVGDIGNNQEKFETQFDMTTKVMEQILKDQQLLAKQQEITGQTVAQLQLKQPLGRTEDPPSPADSDSTVDEPFGNRRTRGQGEFRQADPSNATFDRGMGRRVTGMFSVIALTGRRWLFPGLMAITRVFGVTNARIIFVFSIYRKACGLH